MMRLVCPNCEAKYEVPEDAIPETGRDVQCANCGHAWFQMRPRVETAAAPVVAAPVTPPAPPVAEPEPVVAEPVAEPVAPVAETVVVPAPEPEPQPGPEPEAVAPVAEEPAPVPEPAPEPVVAVVAEAPPAVVEADAGIDDDVAPEAPAAAAVAGAAGYAVDDSVLAILREEAEREARARQAEAARPLETQPDLGIDQAMPVAAKVPDVVAEDPALVARRTRLPDVEEINSTLRPSDVAAEDIAPEAIPTAADGRSSFRSGFLLVLTVAILGSAIYASADAIAEAVPALAGPLQGYVAFVDSLRLQLDGLMQSATVAINGN